MSSSGEFHLDEVLAASLIANRLPGADRRRVVRHLLAGCARCAEKVKNVLELGAWTAPSLFGELADLGEYMGITQIDIDLDLAQGELLWRDVARLPMHRRLAFVRGSRAHRTFGVFKAGLAERRHLSQQRPDQGVALAEVLTNLAEIIDAPTSVSQELRFDWRAEASIGLAQALRIAGDFRAANAALDRAEAFLSHGTQDEVDRGLLIVERGIIQGELGEFERCIETLDHAASAFRVVGDSNNSGKVLLHQAVILRHVDPVRALALAEEGLVRIDKTEVRALLSAHWTMAYCHAELSVIGAQPERKKENQVDHLAEAESILKTYQYLIDEQDEFVRVIFDLLTARIRYRQYRLAEAEQTLREVQGWYLERGFRYEAVFATLDLIELLVDDDRAGEALYLANEILPVMRAWGLHRDTLAVVGLIQENLEKKALTERAFLKLVDRIRRTWYKNGEAGLAKY
ncbi:MAG TPA: hypothetical protein VIE43_23240 [Thermoanaerobaculia bacterium]|nr:hypothetical protein [Thermoanaerobaculia bacterium]